MRYETGKSRPYEDLTPSDYEAYPLWVSAIHEEGVEGQDESWRAPLIGEDAVQADMVATYVPFVLEGTELVGTACYCTRHVAKELAHIPGIPCDVLIEVQLWWKEQWIWLGSDDGPEVDWPVVIEVLPAIEGEKNVRFSLVQELGLVAKRIRI